MIAAAVALALAAPSVAELRDHRRVLIVAAPSARNGRLAAQREVVRAAPRALRERDVTVVGIVADRVSGANDPAADLRRRYRLPAAQFGLVLIGKDGHVALRRSEPIDIAALVGAIDAMPMRRAGLR